MVHWQSWRLLRPSSTSPHAEDHSRARTIAAVKRQGVPKPAAAWLWSSGHRARWAASAPACDRPPAAERDHGMPQYGSSLRTTTRCWQQSEATRISNQWLWPLVQCFPGEKWHGRRDKKTEVDEHLRRRKKKLLKKLPEKLSAILHENTAEKVVELWEVS